MSGSSLKGALVGLLAAVSLAVCLAVVSPATSLAGATDAWLQFQHDAMHSGSNSAETILNKSNVSGLSLLWSSQSIGMAAYGTPIPTGDRVLATGWDGPLVALSRSDGSVLWSAELGLSMYGTTPAIYGSLAIVAGGRYGVGGIVAAYDVQTGEQVWATSLPHDVGAAFPVLYGGKIYLGAGQALCSLSAATGQILWSSLVSNDTDNGITGPPAVSQNGRSLIAADGTGDVFAVNSGTGHLLWRTKLGHGIWRGGPSISGSTGYLTNGDESSEGGGVSLFAFKVTTGRIMWKQDCGDDVHVTPTVGNGVVYVGAINGTMHAIDARTGAVRWVQEVPGEVWSSPALANGVLYVGTESSWLALDAATGHEFWRYSVADLGFANMSSPAVTGGRLYVGSGGGTVQVFGLPD